MKSDPFFNNFFSECKQICRYLAGTSMVPETVYAYEVFFRFYFLHVVNYKSVKWEYFSVDWLRRQNLKTRWVQVPPK